MHNIATASGKIILSGEYAVVFGYPGIAIPAPLKLTATFEQTNIHPMKIIWPDVEETLWIDYLKKIINLCIEHGGPYAGTLTIQNSIPLGKGMGSSTALVIAVTRCLLSPLPFKGEGKGKGLKKIATDIESTLNPNGSGIDFEVIWNEKPVLFHKGKTEILQNTSILVYWCTHYAVLIDTGKPNETTSELVAWIRDKFQAPNSKHQKNSKSQITKNALRTIGHCTERLLSGESPLTVFPDHHRAQVVLGVVPKNVQMLIQTIEESGGVAKVIGAGSRSGGGIVLAIAKNAHIIASSYGYRLLNAEHCVH